MAVVYQIVCRTTGKRYIGSSKNVVVRWGAHRIALRSGRHSSPHFQRSWDKYGEDDFHFGVVVLCTEEEQRQLEQHWLSASILDGTSLNASSNAFGNSKGNGGACKGNSFKLTDEQIAKASAAHHGLKRGPLSDEHREAVSAGNRGKTRSPESIERYRKAALNRTPEHQSKINKSNQKGF
jgi:group I intron endonuclease